MSQEVLIVLVVTAMVIVGLAAAKLMRINLKKLMLGTTGALIGLLLGALLSIPLSNLPAPYGSILPILASTLITLLLVAAFVNQAEAISAALPFMKTATPPAFTSAILVDTSVIIDGRISDIAATGFVPGRLLVPRFVLAELQNIADSDEAMRRGRGRRGLEMLNNIRNTTGVEVEIIEDDIAGITEVDAKLVALAKKLGAHIMTTDYNLNRVAQIEGVRVLNINELSNAIRPVVLPGEEMLVKIVQAGKERNQGVGYLSDGTMIVVENGDKMIGQEVATEVTRVFQTVAGKMIFATPKGQVQSTQRPAKTQTAPAHKERGQQNGRKPAGRPERHGQQNGHRQHKPQAHSAGAIEDRLVSQNQPTRDETGS